MDNDSRFTDIEKRLSKIERLLTALVWAFFIGAVVYAAAYKP